MNIPLLENRVRSMEEMMSDLIATVAQTSMEMKDFKDRVSRFEDKVERYIEEGRREHREFNQQLGAIANKQGRMTEDLVAPSICRILKEVVEIPPSYACGMVPRVRRVHPEDRGRVREFDAIANCGDYVLVTEAKSSLRPRDIDELMDTIREFREYFPEYRDKKIIGSLATLQADEGLIKHASRKGILILAVGNELMDVVNEPGFKPAEF
jgi:hypothetical protein